MGSRWSGRREPSDHPAAVSRERGCSLDWRDFGGDFAVAVAIGLTQPVDSRAMPRVSLPLLDADRGTDRNVLGGPLAPCSHSPTTGFYRYGCCRTGPADVGRHVVCAVMTERFLNFTRGQGNDLQTPLPEYQFPGLNPGDRWCVCALRWLEALKAHAAPPVVLAATHMRALDVLSLEALITMAVDAPDEG